MFHKIKSVLPQANYTLLVSFAEGVSKTYEVKPLFKKWIHNKSIQKTVESRIISDERKIYLKAIKRINDD